LDLKQFIRYGHTVADNNDPYVRLVEEASQSTSEAAVPGAFLVDLFPSRTVLYYYRCFIVFNSSLVKYVPEWMPGAGFKTKAKEWRKLSQAMINVPYDMVKEKFVSGLSFTLFSSISQLATRKMAQRYLVSSLLAWSKMPRALPPGREKLLQKN
jgi:hypothetical protein